MLFLVGPIGAHPAEPMRFGDLKGERLLLPSAGHGLRVILDRCAQDCGFTLHVPVEADSYSILKSLVQRGHGSTILPKAAIHAELDDGSLHATPLRDPVPTRRLIISYPTDRPVPRLARFAGQVIASNVAIMVRQGIWAGQLPDEDRN
jgi:DNA-binding transcriptional LysR family regulator